MALDTKFDIQNLLKKYDLAKIFAEVGIKSHGHKNANFVVIRDGCEIFCV